MLTYMASCGSTTCDQFDATTAKWFKIQEIGLDSSTESGWAQADLMNGTPANITLPSNLAPGNYLLRHEIIALHLANTMGGAEFYPSCSQIIVGGSGTGKPSDDELVSLPGAYSDSDPGIYVPSVSLQSSYIHPEEQELILIVFHRFLMGLQITRSRVQLSLHSSRAPLPPPPPPHPNQRPPNLLPRLHLPHHPPPPKPQEASATHPPANAVSDLRSRTLRRAISASALLVWAQEW